MHRLWYRVCANKTDMIWHVLKTSRRNVILRIVLWQENLENLPIEAIATCSIHSNWFQLYHRTFSAWLHTAPWRPCNDKIVHNFARKQYWRHLKTRTSMRHCFNLSHFAAYFIDLYRSYSRELLVICLRGLQCYLKIESSNLVVTWSWWQIDENRFENRLKSWKKKENNPENPLSFHWCLSMSQLKMSLMSTALPAPRTGVTMCHIRAYRL